MSVQSDTLKVLSKINSIYSRRVAAVYAICIEYAAKAINYFITFQNNNRFWINQSNDAKDRMFANAFRDFEALGWYMAHGVDYGIYLELANDRKHEAIRPVINRFYKPFIDDIKKLYKDVA